MNHTDDQLRALLAKMLPMNAEHWAITATWQQRTRALAEVKGATP